MNYLAHLYLSGNSEKLLIGNFIADAVKGTTFKNYSEGIQKGILLHRKIDSFTDKHEIVRKSKIRLMPKYHKYSAVLVDVFYDHFLAVDWKKYSSVSLIDYTKNIYGLLAKNSHLFPEKSKRFFYYMTSNNILFNYSEVEGIKSALRGLSYRARFDSQMHRAHNELVNDYELYKNEFEIFFPELKYFVKENLSE